VTGNGAAPSAFAPDIRVLTATGESAGATYRTDIDGLRALAVLAVVFFHINSNLAPGGFIGVDIFFVISGFLITSNIRNDISKGRFTFARFYARRIKRIVPALATVVVATLLVGQFVLLPMHLEELAKSAVASMLSVANVFFTYFVDTGYFADSSETKPLLHIWSLGVEEQFYLIWPLLLIGLLSLTKLRRLHALIITVAIAGGLLLSQYLAGSDPTFAYYMLPSRAFELMLGALVVFLPKLHHRAVSEALSVIGLVLIAFSLFFITEDAIFPGFNALPGTVGTAFLIYAATHHKPVVSRALSFEPARWIGFISYSLYLWHWPVLAYLRYAYVHIGWEIGLSAFALMIGLSVLTYRYIEVPCRTSRASSGRIFSLMLIAPTAVIAAVAAPLVVNDGYGVTNTPEFQKQFAKTRRVTRAANRFSYVCQKSVITAADVRDPICIVNNRKKIEPDILLWGDSNAAHYVGILRTIAKKKGFAFRSIAASACPPVFDLPDVYIVKSRRCAASNRVIKDAVSKYRTIIMGGHWSFYAERNPAFLDALEATVADLTNQGKTVVLLGQIPHMEEYDQYCEGKELKIPSLKCEELFSYNRSPNDEADAINVKLSEIAGRHANVRLFAINDIICRDGICSPYIDHVPVYYNSGHLSMAGSLEIGRILTDGNKVPEPFSKF